MDEKILKWLYDVQVAISEIEKYFESNEKNFFEYQKNTMLKRAIERDLEIIGEAINRIITKDDSFTQLITDAKAIVGLRNQVIHAYDSISDENIWSIITNHLPQLKTEINNLIESNK
jgi:uncharacterized protein with HEPN domain